MMFGREPALWMGAVQALLALLIAFGMELSNEQQAGILVASAAICSLIVRQHVSPVGEDEE